MTERRRYIAAGLLVALMVAHARGHHPHPGGKAQAFLIVRDIEAPRDKDKDAAIASAQTGKLSVWMDSKATKTNGTAERRVFDKQEDVTNESKFWRDAMKQDHGTLPSVSTYDGRSWSKPQTFTSLDDLSGKLGAK